MAAAAAQPQVLCIDDEPRIVEGLSAILRRGYDVHVATDADAALRELDLMSEPAVVVCDMRMPKIDGATLLHEIKLRRPATTRILLTGHASREDDARAVNEAEVFRLLHKPCDVAHLRRAIDDGVTQHRLALAERDFLQETLLGAIHALIEVLALANPAAFGRAEQVKRQAMALAGRLGMREFWELEAAALLSQLGYAGLPPALVEKVHFGGTLTPDEQARVNAMPDLTGRLLEHIPRLEPVLQILAAVKLDDARLGALGAGTIGKGARILGLVLEYDALIASGTTHDAVCDRLCGRVARYGAKLVAHLDACVATARELEQDLHLPVRHLRPGMRLGEELRTSTGALLVPRGFEVTRTFVERVANMAPELMDVRVRVSLS